MRFRLVVLAFASLFLTSCELFDQLSARERELEDRAYYEQLRRAFDTGIGVKRD